MLKPSSCLCNINHPNLINFYNLYGNRRLSDLNMTLYLKMSFIIIIIIQILVWEIINFKYMQILCKYFSWRCLWLLLFKSLLISSFRTVWEIIAFMQILSHIHINKIVPRSRTLLVLYGMLLRCGLNLKLLNLHCSAMGITFG